MQKVLNAVRKLSVGQHSSKLYFKGKATHSSLVGGVVTLLAAGLLISYAIIVLHSTFTREIKTTE